MKSVIINALLIILLFSCDMPAGDHYIPPPTLNSKPASVIVIKKPVKVIETNIDIFASEVINTKNIKAEELVSFAETLQGIGYKYASTDPEIGFDCSGFISYVFNHFDISVPRSSIDFTDILREINLKEAKRGDIILFTGTDSTKRVVGHMGIITSSQGQSHEFIHSTSGKAYSVTKTPLNRYYQGCFVKVIRIFKEDEI